MMEHSWHLAVMAFLLAEHANAPVDVLKVMKMVLIHDLVEIDAGDTHLPDVSREYNEAGAGRWLRGGPDFLLFCQRTRQLCCAAFGMNVKPRKLASKSSPHALDKCQPILLNG